jgi:hypothetical protein
MSILNVNQIQPVGSGQTVTISATNIDTGSATFTGSSSATFNNGLNVTGGSVGIGTDNPQYDIHLYRNGDATLFIQADADNVDETHNPKISLSQDGWTSSIFDVGINGTAGDAFTDALANTAYLYSVSNLSSNGIQFATNGAARMYINNSGNVGINTDNPSRRLHVNSGSTDTAALFYSSDAGCYINYQDSTSGAGSGVNIGCVGDDIRFGSGAGGEFGRITSDGYFTMSAQPAAMVYKTGTAQLITANAIYNYDATAISQGGMTINASRNRITVPVAGKYMISAASSGSVSTASAGDGWRLQLLRDGAVYGNTYLYPIETTGSEVGQEFSLQFSIVVNAAADDYFEVQLENVGSARATMNYGYFSIYLLG